MKRILLTLFAVGISVAAFGQGIVYPGQVNLGNLVSPDLRAPVYGPEADNSVIIQGNTSAGSPVGNKVYNATSRVQGTGFTAQLWGYEGTILDAKSYAAFTPTCSFRTATTGTGGYLQSPPSALVLQQGDSILVEAGKTATFVLRAWDNKNGTITSWAQVEADINILRGESLPFQLVVGGGSSPAANLVGLQSFNLHTAIPEPSVIALGVLGLGALVLFRRRK